MVPKARYTTSELMMHNGNPLLEALPPVLNRQQIFDKLKLIPDFKSVLSYSKEHRKFFLDGLDVYYPLPEAILIKENFDRLLRQSYLQRNPLDKRTEGIKAESMSVIGVSGIGKSKSLDRVMETYPQVIEHEEFNGKLLYMKQVVYLKLVCPSDGSLKGLLMQMYKKIDVLIESSYYNRFVTSRATLDTLVIAAYEILRTINLGVLVIDELNFLARVKSGNQDALLDFLVYLNNIIGISIVFVGTPSAFQIIGSDLRQARRSSGICSDIIWDRYEISNPWKELIRTLFQYQITDKEAKLTEDIIRILHYESQGITDILRKLLFKSQVFAVDNNYDEINGMIIQHVAQNELSVVKPIMNVLKVGKEKDIFDYKDIYIPLHYRDNQQGCSKEPAKRILEVKGNEEIKKIESKKTVKIKESIDVNDIRIIVASNDEPGLSAYEKLKNKGLIKPKL